MKRIAVYCGASKGHDPSYVQKAYDLGKYFAEQGLGISIWCRVNWYYGCHSRWCIRSWRQSYWRHA